MDQLWKERSLDLRMSPYECVSTGDNLGMLEVVRDSETIANIVGDAVDKNLSGVRRKRAAMKMVFKEDVVARWLKRECALRAEAEAKERDRARPSGGRQRSVSHAVRRSRDHDGDERKSSKAEAMRRAAGEISREMIARRRSRSGDVSTAAPMPALSTNQCVVGWCRCGGRVVWTSHAVPVVSTDMPWPRHSLHDHAPGVLLLLIARVLPWEMKRLTLAVPCGVGVQLLCRNVRHRHRRSPQRQHHAQQERKVLPH